MKTYYSLILAFVLAFSVSAQKKQLKAAQKLVDAASYDAAFSSLNENSDLLEAAEPKYVSHYHYLLGVTLQAKKEFLKVVAEFDKVKSIEKEAGLNKYTQLINGNKPSLVADVVNQAVSYNTDENYKDAGELLYLAYELDGENLDYLYYAASSAVNSGDFEKALPYYLLLKEKNYTGSVTKFYATEVATGEESEVDQNTYKIYKKSKEFTNFRTGLSKSRLPEIVKNIALIYSSQGNLDEAKKSYEDARLTSPNDAQLLVSEANFYLREFNDSDMFIKLADLAIKANPSDAVTWFNLGVVYSEMGNYQKSYDSYKKSIELDGKNYDSYNNLVSLILDKQISLREEFDKLGSSRQDDIRAAEINSEIKNIYMEAAAVYERLLKVNPKNREAIDMLKKIYYQVDDTANFKKYSDMLEAL